MQRGTSTPLILGAGPFGRAPNGPVRIQEFCVKQFNPSQEFFIKKKRSKQDLAQINRVVNVVQESGTEGYFCVAERAIQPSHYITEQANVQKYVRASHYQRLIKCQH